MGWFQVGLFVRRRSPRSILLWWVRRLGARPPGPRRSICTCSRIANFRAAAAVNVAVGVGLMGGLFMLPLFLQQMLGFTATQSGLILVPGALATAVAMPICGRLSDRMRSTDPHGVRACSCSRRACG